jgi:general secretion pathway protein K
MAKEPGKTDDHGPGSTWPAIPGSERGIALIIVILMVSVIVAVTLQLNRSSRSEIHDAANLKDGIRLFYIAKSGFHLGQGFLAVHQGDIFTLNEDWAMPGKIADRADTLFGAGVLRVAIEDESGKIPVHRLLNGQVFNPAVRDLMARLLKQPEFGLKDKDVDDILDSLKDWMDADDIVTGGGAETPYYAALAKPYAAKNGPLDCIEELMMIKGITREIYEGTKDRPGLRQLLTIYGDGRININTAPILVLRSLSPDMTVGGAQRMDEYRRTPGKDLSNTDWYRSEVSGVNLDSQLVTTQSNVFRIICEGRTGSMVRSIESVVMRPQGGKTMKILTWKAS